jgi:hypothetical protein
MDDSQNEVLRPLFGGLAQKSLDNANRKSFMNYKAMKATDGFYSPSLAAFLAVQDTPRLVLGVVH